MESRPIFQMCYGWDIPAIHYGWIFAIESRIYQSISYTIPWTTEGSIKDFEYYLPGEIKGEYADFKVKCSGEVFLLEHGILKQPLRFTAYYPYEHLNLPGDPFIRTLPYVGEHKDLIKPYRLFLHLIPIDLFQMDRLYEEQSVAFVGLTPTFGKKRG